MAKKSYLVDLDKLDPNTFFLDNKLIDKQTP